MPGSQLSVELVKSCDRFYRKLKRSGEKTVVGNVRGLFSQDSLIDVFIRHFSNFYQNFLFLTLKMLMLVHEIILIYTSCNYAAGFDVHVLLKQVCWENAIFW